MDLKNTSGGYRLKSSLTVKKKGASGALVLDSESGQIFECSDDMACLMRILYEQGTGTRGGQDGQDGMTFANLLARMREDSATFKDNPEGEDTLRTALELLAGMKWVGTEARS